MKQGRNDPRTDSPHQADGHQTPTTAGWKEWVSLPSLGLDWVKAKLDTGARSSALHATDIELFVSDGREMVRFTTHPWQGSPLDATTLELPVVDTRRVRSSTGHAQTRPVVRTDVRLGAQTFTTEFTLTDRHSMGLRILIGRSALEGRFLVDSSSAYLCRRPSRAIRDRNRSAG